VPTSVELPVLTGNLILDCYDRMPEIVARCAPAAGGPVGFALPELDDAVRGFFAVATASWRPLGEYGGHGITLLDLTGNPGTHTTKTYASLLIVARAVEHIRRTGRKVLIFSPTSGNKGVALRDAVLRALDAGLATPEQLRVATIAPSTGRHKLRATRLSEDPALRRLNPQMSYSGTDPETVKALAREFARTHTPRDGVDVWFSLDLANYMIADAARALFEHHVDPATRPRLHAHAVSSAFGLLGYHAGRDLLESTRAATPATRPASLLVQHLAAPDMVLSLRHTALPAYSLDEGLYHREGDDPHFPAVTYDPAEVLDPTFYTHNPPTSPAMNDLIARHGGDGIVVSLAECIGRYPQLRARLAPAGVALPADPRRLHEWSTVMALTGVLNAADRGLLDPGRDIVVHGTGHYAEGMYEPLCGTALHPVTTPADIAEALEP